MRHLLGVVSRQEMLVQGLAALGLLTILDHLFREYDLQEDMFAEAWGLVSLVHLLFWCDMGVGIDVLCLLRVQEAVSKNVEEPEGE